MSDYWQGIITGIIGLLFSQYVIVRLIRRFIDMVMILMEGESEAWHRLKRWVADDAPAFASGWFLLYLCAHFYYLGAAPLYITIPWSIAIVCIGILKVRRFRDTKETQWTTYNKQLSEGTTQNQTTAPHSLSIQAGGDIYFSKDRFDKEKSNEQ